jgi:hypothetical protein
LETSSKNVCFTGAKCSQDFLLKELQLQMIVISNSSLAKISDTVELCLMQLASSLLMEKKKVDAFIIPPTYFRKMITNSRQNKSY